MLSNAYFLAKFRFGTAENEPVRNLQNFANNYFPNFANPDPLTRLAPAARLAARLAARQVPAAYYLSRPRFGCSCGTISDSTGRGRHFSAKYYCKCFPNVWYLKGLAKFFGLFADFDKALSGFREIFLRLLRYPLEFQKFMKHS